MCVSSRDNRYMHVVQSAFSPSYAIAHQSKQSLLQSTELHSLCITMAGIDLLRLASDVRGQVEPPSHYAFSSSYHQGDFRCATACEKLCCFGDDKHWIHVAIFLGLSHITPYPYNHFYKSSNRRVCSSAHKAQVTLASDVVSEQACRHYLTRMQSCKISDTLFTCAGVDCVQCMLSSSIESEDAQESGIIMASHQLE